MSRYSMDKVAYFKDFLCLHKKVKCLILFVYLSDFASLCDELQSLQFHEACENSRNLSVSHREVFYYQRSC